MEKQEILAVKYRPTTFNQVVGQDSLIQEIKGLIKTEAYKVLNSIVLSGTSGGGKTTIARLMAKAMNCTHKNNKPCNTCNNCKLLDKNQYPDYLELDSTSFRGVKDMEPLKQLAKQYPVIQGGTRIIYLDEAHVLSNQATDLLLKLLEDGKNSTIWIFATTQLHSLRPALINRSTSLKIKTINQEGLLKEIKRITQLEGIQTKPNFLEDIVRINREGMRDVIAGLDKYYKAYGKDLTKISIDLYSKEDTILNTFNKLKTKGLVRATISIDRLDISPKEFNKVITNIQIGLAIIDNSTLLEEIPQLGININKLKEFNSYIGSNKKALIEASINFNIDTIEKMKLYLLLLQELYKKEESITVQITSEVNKENNLNHKRRGVKTVNKVKTKVVKKNIKLKKPKKKEKENQVLKNLGFK